MTTPGKAWPRGRTVADDFVDLSEAKRTTLGEALARYRAEVTPIKKGAKQVKGPHPGLAARSAGRAASRLDPPDGHCRLAQRARCGRQGADNPQERAHHHQPATEWGMQGLQNPVRGVRMPRSRSARDRRLEPGEQELVLAGCDACGQRLLRPIVIWALETAMRQGEILALEARSRPIQGNSLTR